MLLIGGPGVPNVVATGLVVAAALICITCGPGSSAIGGVDDSGGGVPVDGPGQRFSEVDRSHVNPGQAHAEYNSVPATSGSHFGQPLAPAPWGIYDEVLPDEVLLHNLEHGGIGVHYNCPDGCPELVSQLSEIVDRAIRSGRKVIMSPYPNMETMIAMTAWTFLDAMDEFDEERVKDFIEAHESSPNAPEPNVP